MVHLIACEVLRPEVEYLLPSLSESFRISWMKQGLHDTPDQLRTEVQQKIYEHEDEGAEVILLGYALCGMGLSGVTSRRAELVLPNVHDCVPLLLGVGQEEANRLSLDGHTLWMSPGWNRYCWEESALHREGRYADYVERFGKEAADYLFEIEGTYFKDYEAATLIRWPEDWPDMDALVEQSKRIAAVKNLPYGECKGTPVFLRALLEGGHGPDFLRIPPGSTVELNGDGNLSVVRRQA